MKLPWKLIGHAGLDIAKRIVPAVGVVEALFDQLRTGAGHDKQETVLQHVLTEITAGLGALGPVLAVNPFVIAKMRALIDAVVDLQNTVTEQAAASSK